MRAAQRSAQARRELDLRFASADAAALRARPRSGWIRAIRDALGMTQATLGRHMGISGAAVAKLERAEVAGGITVAKLADVAAAMDCHVVYALVPNVTLQETVERQARRIALERLTTVRDTMALEGQAIDVQRLADDVDRTSRDIIERDEVWREDVRVAPGRSSVPGR